MNYSLLIEERRSARAFQEKPVPEKMIDEIKAYHDNGCERLIKDLKTEVLIFDNKQGEALEKAAGYNDILVGSPQYLVLLSDADENAELNAGYIMEDMILKLSDLGLGSCWLTFTDGDKIKNALSLNTDKNVAALAAFGYPEKVKKKIHVNIFSMSDVSIEEKRHYFDPKKKISDLVYIDEYGNQDGLDERIGFYDDALWESFHAVCDSPSYMNRQPYSFLIKDWNVYLLSEEDEVTGEIDRDLNLGVAMLHFAAVAQTYISTLEWQLEKDIPDIREGIRVIASCRL